MLKHVYEAWGEYERRTRRYRRFVRKYDTSGALVLFVGTVAVLAIVLTVYAPSFTREWNEVLATRLIAIISNGLFLRVLYTWFYGSKVEMPSFLNGASI